jgi:hypothetical protein
MGGVRRGACKRNPDIVYVGFSKQESEPLCVFSSSAHGRGNTAHSH